MRGRSTACFFSTDGLRRDVDAGVLVMYTNVCLQAMNFRLFLLVFHSWGVCVCEKWCGVACTFYSLFFLVFVTVAILYITQSHYSHFP